MPFELYQYEELDSTNLQASALLSSRKLNTPFVVCSNYQTGGKGQGENRWESEASANLLCSYVLFPEALKIKDYFNLSIMASLAVADSLEKYCPDIRVKWPNDIFAAGGKLGGILIENTLQRENIIRTIVGIGININQTVFPKFPYRAVSLCLLNGKEYKTDLIRENLSENIELRYHELISGDTSVMKEPYLSKLFGINEQRWFRAHGKKFQATIRGIGENGELLTEDVTGKISLWSFKEIEYLDFQKG